MLSDFKIQRVLVVFVLWAINNLVDMSCPSFRVAPRRFRLYQSCARSSGQSRTDNRCVSILGPDVFGPIAANEVQSLAEKPSPAILETVLKMARVRRAWLLNSPASLPPPPTGCSHDRSQQQELYSVVTHCPRAARSRLRRFCPNRWLSKLPSA